MSAQGRALRCVAISAFLRCALSILLPLRLLMYSWPWPLSSSRHRLAEQNSQRTFALDRNRPCICRESQPVDLPTRISSPSASSSSGWRLIFSSRRNSDSLTSVTSSICFRVKPARNCPRMSTSLGSRRRALAVTAASNAAAWLSKKIIWNVRVGRCRGVWCVDYVGSCVAQLGKVAFFRRKGPWFDSPRRLFRQTIYPRGGTIPREYIHR